MPYLRRMRDRHQITIPPTILREAGALAPETLFLISVDEGKIVLEPRKVVSGGDWDAEDFDLLEKLVKKQLQSKSYTEYDNPKAAKKHLRHPR